MADRNALRRRQRILDDEHYGPIYVRLPKWQRVKVDELIEANRGKAARKLLDDLREQAKAKRRLGSRPKLEQQAAAHIVRAHGGRADPETVEAGVKIMTNQELRDSLDMNSSELAARAARGNRRPDLSGEPRNPWWYH